MDAFPIEDLRVFSAVLGSLLVPTGYLIVRALGHGRLAASMAAGLLIFGKINHTCHVHVYSCAM